MGNELIKDYSVGEHSIGTGGINQMWKMYEGKKSDATKRVVTIFMIEKKQFEKMPKEAREELLANLRKESQSLAKIRHPNVLSLVEPLKEDEKRMAFITERVDCTLLNLLQSGKVKDTCTTELELKQQIQGLIDTIAFLHNDLKMAHLNLAPEHIYITPEGKWKIGCFTFSTQILTRDLVECPSLNFFDETNSVKIAPNLSFAAPESVAQPAKCHFASDIFALGCIFYALLKAWYKGRGVNDDDILLLNVTTARGHSDAVSKAYGKTLMQYIPASLQQTLQRMITADPYTRARLDEVMRCQWLKDPLLQSIKILETLFEKDTAQQIGFLAGFIRILSKYNAKNMQQRIIPAILSLFKVDGLANFLVALSFRLQEKNIISPTDFTTIFWPQIKLLTARKDMPAQVLFQLVHKMHILSELVSKDELNSSIFPLYLKCFECNVVTLEELALKKTLDFVIKKFDYPTTIKVKVLPRVLHLCQHQAHVDVRKHALLTLRSMHSLLDKASIQDSVLATLEKVRKLPNNTPRINMIILSIFESSLGSLGIDVLAGRLLGSMIPFLTDQNLSRKEFNAYFTSITKILNRIKEERTAGFGSEQVNLMPEQEDLNEEIVVKDLSTDILKEEQVKTAGEFDFLAPFEPTAVQDFGNGLVPRQPQAPAAIEQQPLPLQQMPLEQPSLFGKPTGSAPTGNQGLSWELKPEPIQAKPQGLNFSKFSQPQQPANSQPTASFGLGIDLGGGLDLTPPPKPQGGTNPGGGWGSDPYQPPGGGGFGNPHGMPSYGQPVQSQGQGLLSMGGNSTGFGMDQRPAFQGQMPAPQGGPLPKGNLAKLHYDPFADLNQDIALGMPVGDTTPIGIVTGTPIGMGNVGGGGFGMGSQNQTGMMGNQGFNQMQPQPQFGQGMPVQQSTPAYQTGYPTGAPMGQPAYSQPMPQQGGSLGGGYGLDLNSGGFGGSSGLSMQTGGGYQQQSQGFGQSSAFQDIPASMFQAPAPTPASQTGQNLFAGTSMKSTGPQWGTQQQGSQGMTGAPFGGATQSGPRPGGFGGFKPVQQSSNNSTDLI